jgi:hypothetical protein
MNRSDAQALVDIRTFKVAQYSAVSMEDALALIGEDRFAELLADKVRCLGPTRGTIYPWNVVDYLQMGIIPRAAMSSDSG